MWAPKHAAARTSSKDEAPYLTNDLIRCRRRCWRRRDASLYKDSRTLLQFRRPALCVSNLLGAVLIRRAVHCGDCDSSISKLSFTNARVALKLRGVQMWWVGVTALAVMEFGWIPVSQSSTRLAASFFGVSVQMHSILLVLGSITSASRCVYAPPQSERERTYTHKIS